MLLIVGMAFSGSPWQIVFINTGGSKQCIPGVGANYEESSWHA